MAVDDEQQHRIVVRQVGHRERAGTRIATLQVQSQLDAQNLMLEQQMNSQLMMLQEAHMAQRSALEQQAAALTLEYQVKRNVASRGTCFFLFFCSKNFRTKK